MLVCAIFAVACVLSFRCIVINCIVWFMRIEIEYISQMNSLFF